MKIGNLGGFGGSSDLEDIVDVEKEGKEEKEGQEEKETTDLTLEGKELKILTPTYLTKLIDAKLSFDLLKAKLEKEFPGYTLPTAEDIKTLKLGKEKIENLGKLTEGRNFPENRTNLFTCDDGVYNRTRLDVRDHYNKLAINTNDQGWPHIREDDFIFLIKKTNS